MNKKSPSAAGNGSWRIGLLLAAAAFAGCHELDLGPAPDNYVGPKNGRSLTVETSDAAIVPSAVPVSTLPGATQPTTRIAATRLATSQPDTRAATEPGTLHLTVEEALITALGNNPSLHIQRLNPLISRTGEQSARAAFDPDLTGNITASRTASPAGGEIGSRTNPPGAGYGNTVTGTVGVQEFLPTGTSINVGATSDLGSSDAFSDSSTRLGISVNQALLRGAGLDVNLATLRQAQLDTKVSQYQLRGFAETLISQVEQTYWNYALALRQIEIVQESLDVAQQQLDQTNELIRVGRVAESERAAAEAQVALQKENVINAKAVVDTTRLKFLQLLNPGKADFWKSDVVLTQQPFVPKSIIEDVEAHMNVALNMRPDLNEARLQIQKGDIDIVVTKNGLLPKMDLFVTLGKSGYARSFGGTIPNLDSPFYDAQVGLNFEYPITNGAARAAYRRSLLTQEQTKESLDNLIQLAEVDVRSAYIDVIRLKEQITATAATRIAQEVNYNAETEKFRVGRSTSLLVSQAQRDLEAAQINEVQAIAGYLNSMINLYQVEGSLLERRGIAAPGVKPAILSSAATQPVAIH